MSIRAVIFDWGGTLTPWHDVDLTAQWYAYAEIYAPERAASLAESLARAEHERWRESFHSHGAAGTGALDEIFTNHGIDITSARHLRALAHYVDFWQPHTYADPQAAPLLHALRQRGLGTAVLSNTMWPRTFHEEVFERDGIINLFDVRVYSSELPAAKPHAEAFGAVLSAFASRGDTFSANECVFVGDRLVDDIHGAQQMGMKAVWIPHSNLDDNHHAAQSVTPDATIKELPELLAVIHDWTERERTVHP